jgi:hypothetical protein
MHTALSKGLLTVPKAEWGGGATVNQHPPVHHPLDACYYRVVDEP